MSSWEPPETEDKGSSHDPGVKGSEVIEGRNLATTVSNFDWTDYVLLAVIASIPTVFLTVILLWELFPEYQDTASAIVGKLIDVLPLVVATLPQ